MVYSLPRVTKAKPARSESTAPVPYCPSSRESRTFRWELMCCEVAGDGSLALAQFLPVAPVATVAKTAEPLETVGLADDGPRPHHLPALASRVARGTDVIQPTMSGWQFFGLGQGPLASSLARSIGIKDHPGVSCSIHQASGLFLEGSRATEQIVEKQGAESFNRLRCQGR